MPLGDENNLEGRLHGEQPETVRDPFVLRVLYMVLIWVMLSLANTVLGVATWSSLSSWR